MDDESRHEERQRGQNELEVVDPMPGMIGGRSDRLGNRAGRYSGGALGSEINFEERRK